MKHEQNLIWLDLEMSGLNVAKDVILEIAVVVTDGNLNVVAEGPSLVINQADRILEHMDPWCVNQHKKSGLTFDVQQSRMTEAEAEKEVLEFLREYTYPKKAPLCGSSIWVDRMFLRAYMPNLESHTHYRNVDVSSIKELVARWYTPDLEKELGPSKDLHRALADIYESINELKFYRDRFFITPGQ